MVGCFPSVQLLLEAGCSIDDYHPEVWSELSILQAMFEWSDIITVLVEGLASRRRQLLELAEQRLPKQILAQLRLQNDSLPDQEASAVYALIERSQHFSPVIS